MLTCRVPASFVQANGALRASYWAMTPTCAFTPQT
jgi:hypothetical protein